MGSVLSVNVSVPRENRVKRGQMTGIDKRPTDGPVEVRAPGLKGAGLGSGLVGDLVADGRHHGGDEQAVYAYAREDYDWWEEQLGVPLAGGCFGENLTTLGVDVTRAVLGEIWRIGPELVLQVRSPRIPCSNFQDTMGRAGWVKRFTREARPGAYLRVVTPGTVRAGDTIAVEPPPAHGHTIGVAFRALTLERHLLPSLADADGADPEILRAARA